MERDHAREQGDLSARNAGGGMKIVEKKNRVLPEIERRVVFEFDDRAPLSGDKAVAGLERQVGDGLLPIRLFAVAVFRGARHAHVALNIADSGDLGIDRIRKMLAHDEEGALA